MISRRAESPAISALYYVMIGVVCAAAGMHEGAKLRECPTLLDDGRRLQRQELNPRVCHYAPPPRGLEWYSPTELRRIARAREVMEKTK